MASPAPLGEEVPLRGSLDAYLVIELVGEGSFGKVYKARRRFTGQTVAIKFIMKHGKSEKDIRSLRQEIEILRTLAHDNIIRLVDTFETRSEFAVVTEFAVGELFEVLDDEQSLGEAEVAAIARQLVAALHYLHSNRVIHRDMKPQNILVGARKRVKLCDFGFARAMSSQTLVLTSIKGTPLYMAPELVQEQPYTHAVDLWSLGVILYELFVGRPPFFTNSIYSLIQLIMHEQVSYPDSMSPHFQHFLSGLLTKKPSDRLSWPALLHHPFLQLGLAEDPQQSLRDSTARQPRPHSAPQLRLQPRRPSSAGGGRPSLHGEASEAAIPRPSREGEGGGWAAGQASFPGPSHDSAAPGGGRTYLSTAPPSEQPPLSASGGGATARGIGGPPSRELAALEAAAAACEGLSSRARSLRGDPSVVARLLRSAAGEGAGSGPDAACALRTILSLASAGWGDAEGDAAADSLAAASPAALVAVGRARLARCGTSSASDPSAPPLLALTLRCLAALLPPKGALPDASSAASAPALCGLVAEALRRCDAAADPPGAARAAAARLAAETLSRVAARGRGEESNLAAHSISGSALLPELASVALAGTAGARGASNAAAVDALLALGAAARLAGCGASAAGAVLGGGGGGKAAAAASMGVALRGEAGEGAQAAAATLVAAAASASPELAAFAEPHITAALLSAAARAAAASGAEGGEGAAAAAAAVVDACAALCEAAAAAVGDAEEERGAGGGDACTQCAAYLLGEGRLAALAALLRPPLAPSAASLLLPAASRLLAAPFAAADAAAESRGGEAGATSPALHSVPASPSPYPSPLPAASAPALPQTTPTALSDYQAALLQLGLPAAITAALPSASPSRLPAPVALLLRLTLGSPAFGDAFVAAGGLQPTCVAHVLDGGGPSPAPAAVAADFLLLISQLARGGAQHYQRLCAAGLAPHLARLAVEGEGGDAAPGDSRAVARAAARAAVRGRACSAAGNLCRHGPAFYGQAAHAGLPAVLCAALRDSDASVRKFAAFAVGNAAFHSDELYAALGGCCAPLVRLTGEAESEKTRANAAGALGNLARNGASLAAQLVGAEAPAALLRLATGGLQATGGPPLSAVRVALFSLGNFCALPLAKVRLVQLGARDVAVRMGAEEGAAGADAACRRYALRLLAKLDGVEPAR